MRVIAACQRDSWPGNVRELRNVLDRALALSPEAHSFDQLRISLPGEASREDDELLVRTLLPYAEAKQLLLDGFERRYLRDLLVRNDGNISAAGREAQLDRKHLRSLLRKHGLI
ncbi:Sigma-54 dependent transcriptional regulator, Fis family protein [Enhygromyxa salina]|uniref:Sigma-54 dependent transcriptional regulator, Fis family protein n=1 Tax=Enhygromyxa salina TaxID=215803 RepID=A0A0C2CZ76_9BACT|nr:Sigma-54 dependent transcriptional regulator, Fis family protein [Enhygromyxa salina]